MSLQKENSKFILNFKKLGVEARYSFPPLNFHQFTKFYYQPNIIFT